MSYYEDERPRRRSTRERPRDDYYDETAYNTRDNVRSSAMVRRRDSSIDSVEEVRRDFSPPDGRGGYYRETTIRKSGTRPAASRSYDDDRYFDDDRSRYSRRDSSYYSGRRSRDFDDRRDRRRSSRYDEYSDYSSRSRSPPPKKKERRKSMPEEALEALGLGGVAGALLGRKDRDRSSSRDRDSRYSRSRGNRDDSRDRGKSHGKEQLTQALKAAVLAGAGEAFRARKEPGGWGGEKGKRVLTAAFAAGGVDGLINSHKDPDDHKTRDTIGSAIAGLATSRLVNGPRSKSRGPGSRSPDSRRGRSESRGRGGLGDVAAGGVLAATAKNVVDAIRSRSRGGGDRGRSGSRGSSRGSYDSRAQRRPSVRERSRSVVARGLAAVGLDKQADKMDPARRASRRYSDEYSNDGGYDNVSHQMPPQSSSEVGPNGIGRSRSVGPMASGGLVSPPPQGYRLDYGPHHYGDPATDSDSDLGSSSEEEKEHKKGRKRLLITGGLATVATIHAGHSVYQSMEKREARRKAVRKGEITPEQARSNKNRDRLQDAASIGLAALGLKGAYSEWKEVKETQAEHEETKEKIKRHAEKRELRRLKSQMATDGQFYGGEYSNSMPNLHNNRSGASAVSYSPGGGAYYNGDGPYGAGVPGHSPSPYYYQDENPYGWVAQDQQNQGPHAPPPTSQQPYPPQPQHYDPNMHPPPSNSTPGPPATGSGYPPPPMGPAAQQPHNPYN